MLALKLTGYRMRSVFFGSSKVRQATANQHGENDP
jgi:hypothetical protein